MTAGVTFTNGKAEMAYLESDGRTWWSGGNPLPEGASLNEWANAAGFNWSIKTAPVTFFDEHGIRHDFDDRVVQYRGDNFYGLGVTSSNYNVVQPIETLEHMFRVCDRIGARMRSAGTLFGGRQFWSQASLEGAETYVLDPKDRVRRNILMCSSADMTLANTWKFLDIRVVCSNTLTAGLNGVGRRVTQSHRSVIDYDAIDEKLGITQAEAFVKDVEGLRKLASTPIRKYDMARIILDLYVKEPESMSEEDLARVVTRSRPMRRMMALSTSDDLIGFDMKGVKGTAWGALNVVTQYVDHDGGARTVDRRWQKAMFTSGDTIKTRAKHLLLTYSDGISLPKCKLSNPVIYELMMTE